MSKAAARIASDDVTRLSALLVEVSAAVGAVRSTLDTGAEELATLRAAHGLTEAAVRLSSATFDVIVGGWRDRETSCE